VLVGLAPGAERLYTSYGREGSPGSRPAITSQFATASDQRTIARHLCSLVMTADGALESAVAAARAMATAPSGSLM
jgi:hypothetical protein